MALLASVMVALSLPAGAVPHRQVQALDRSTVDRPDEVSGPMIHLIYATPADGPDRQLDTSGTVASEFNVGDGWFASQTGLNYRLDTVGGEPDVSFVRFPLTDAQVHAPNNSSVLLQQLAAASFNNPQKIYVVFYDGSATTACGTSNLDRLAVEYLQGYASTYPAGSPPCSSQPLLPGGATYPTTRPVYLELGTMHEIVHATPPGYVSSCAPHWDSANPHHTTDTNDLMFGGGDSGKIWGQGGLTVDPGQDDYFGANVPKGCPNLKDSPYLTNQAYVGLSVKVSSPGGTVEVGGNTCTTFQECQLKFRTNAPVTLTADPNGGYKFVGWSGNCSGASLTCTVTMSSARSVMATFNKAKPKTATLQVTAIGKGVVVGPGVKCGSGFKSCSTTTTTAVKKKLTAKPAKGFKQKWSGACSGTGKTCVVNLVPGAPARKVRVTFTR